MQLSELIFDEKSLGRGSYGVVQLAVHKPTNLTVAVKKIDKSSLKTSKMKETLKREI